MVFLVSVGKKVSKCDVYESREGEVVTPLWRYLRGALHIVLITYYDGSRED
jgi:hypothetical protein